MKNRFIILSGATVLGIVGSVLGQETKPADPPPAAQPPDKKPAPTLDDLLGVEKEGPKDSKPAKPVADPTRTALERKLAMEQAQEQFKQAVVLMDETATRIKDGRDTGLQTQRLQEDIIRKLNMVISEAEKQQQQQKKQSKSKKQQQQQQEKDQANQQKNSSQPHGKEAAPDTIDPPMREAANPLPGTAARGAAWGSLPERVRQALLQGDADRYSTLYHKWTEAYYKKLAEEANK